MDDGGVKLLATGKERFVAKVDIEVSRASREAIRAVEKNGGSVLSVYLTPLALRAVVKPEKFPFPLKSPLPPPRILPYYTDARNRGYLSSKVQLAQLKKRISEGVQDPASLLPVYVGGGPVDMATEVVHGGKGTAAAAPASAAAAAPQASQAAAQAQAPGAPAAEAAKA